MKQLERLFISNDSQLVVGQVNGEYATPHSMDSNERADALATVAASIPVKETVFLPIQYQMASSITTNRVSQIDKTSPS